MTGKGGRNLSAQAAVAPAFAEAPQVEPEFELHLCMGEALVVDDSPDITELLAAVSVLRSNETMM